MTATQGSGVGSEVELVADASSSSDDVVDSDSPAHDTVGDSTDGGGAPRRSSPPLRPSLRHPRGQLLRELATVVAAAGVGLATLIGALKLGGAVEGSSLPGIPSAGPLTNWGLPIARALAEAAGVGAVGFSVTAAFLVPAGDRLVSATGYRLLRRASWCAFAWTLLVLTELVFTVSDVLGRPLSEVNSMELVWHFATSVAQGQSLLWQAGLAAVVAVGARLVLSRGGAALFAIGAVVAILPPAFTGHSAAAGNHQLAITSLAMHIVGAALWIGGLLALFALRSSSVLAGAAARYSRLALGCFVGVGISGVVNAAIRLGALDQLWRSHYGWLILGKTSALVIMGSLGALHRKRTLPALARQQPRAFRRLAIGELLVFGATLGLAVGLSRSKTPVPAHPQSVDRVTDLIGFAMPPAPSMGRMLGDVLPDMYFLTIVLIGISAYLAGVWRLRRNGVRWPIGRTASWLAGMVILGAVTNLGFARYAYVLFSVHMTQHMVLSMLAPILLVLGAPATLALRALRHSPDPATRGPREWLLVVLHSRFTHVLTHPLVAGALFVSSLYGLYFSSLFETAMRYHLGHLLMLTHFVGVGYLFFWAIIGIDPGRRELPHPVLILVHFGVMIFHAFFGVALMQSTTVIAKPWFAVLHPSWGASLLSDQSLGAGITWAFGEVPSAIVFAALVVQWIRADEREQRRFDRAADRAEARARAKEANSPSGSSEEPDTLDAGDPDDALAQYNAYLERLHHADQQR